MQLNEALTCPILGWPAFTTNHPGPGCGCFANKVSELTKTLRGVRWCIGPRICVQVEAEPAGHLAQLLMVESAAGFISNVGCLLYQADRDLPNRFSEPTST